MAHVFTNSNDALLLRRCVLLQLYAASPATMPVETIITGMQISGFAVNNQEILAVLDYLEDKNYVSFKISKISSSHRRAKLTALGRDYIESGEF